MEELSLIRKNEAVMEIEQCAEDDCFYCTLRLLPDDVQAIVGGFLCGVDGVNLGAYAHSALGWTLAVEELERHSLIEAKLGYFPKYSAVKPSSDEPDWNAMWEAKAYRNGLLRGRWMITLGLILLALPRTEALNTDSVIVAVNAADWQDWLLLIAILVSWSFLQPMVVKLVTLLTTKVRALFYWWYLLTVETLLYPFYWWRTTKYEPEVVDTAPLPTGTGIYIGYSEIHGRVVHIVAVEGRKYTCIPSEDDTLSEEDEMAMSGSSLSKCRPRPVGVILRTFNDKSKVLGCYFRIGTQLVTASHVAANVSSVEGEYSLTAIDKTGKLSGFSIPIKPGDFAAEKNLYHKNHDVFVKEVQHSQWSQLGLADLSGKIGSSSYGTNVNAYGVVDGVLQTSIGKTSKADKLFEFCHRATTHAGFSGSPLFEGGRLIGMHVRGSVDRNTAVRIETILHNLDHQEAGDYYSADWYQDDDDRYYVRDPNRNSRRYRLEEYDGEIIGMNDEGEIYYGNIDEQDDWLEKYRINQKEKQPTRQRLKDYEPDKNWGDYEAHLERIVDSKVRACLESSIPSRPYVYHDDTQNLEDEPQTTQNIGKSSPRKRKNNKKGKTHENARLESADTEFLQLVREEKPMQVPRLRKQNDEVEEWFQANKEKLKNLGYKPGEYAFPKMTAQEEETSFKNYVNKFKNRCASKKKGYNEKRVIKLVSKLMAKAKVYAPADYKSENRLREIINSRYVHESHSPGHPFISQGMPTNAAVLKDIGEVSLAQLVVTEWYDEIICRVFPKGEPHKMAKLKAQLNRLIAGFPVTKLIKHVSLFKEVSESIMENKYQTPCKMNWSPLIPGDNRRMAGLFPGEVVDSDKNTWDFNVFEDMYRMLAEVLVALYMKPAGMTDKQFEEFKDDIRQAVEEVSKALYILSSGKVFKIAKAGIMKSGWFLTIVANTILQLIHHVGVLVAAGCSDAEILADCKTFVAGGDDVKQTMPPISLDKYKDISAAMGVEMTFEKKESIIGSEYFSHEFIMYDNMVGVVPMRLTKGIETLRRAKPETLGQTLCNIMRNWVWSDEHFNLWSDFYSTLYHKHGKEAYPLDNLPCRSELRAALNGDERYVEEVGENEQTDDVWFRSLYGSVHFE